jgi:hypothetical protein
MNLTEAEIQLLIDYARCKFLEERWPMSPALRAVREALGRIEPKPEPLPVPKPYVPSTIGKRKRR